MRTAFTVFKKEVLDNFRDRRTLVSALLMGPLFGPLLFAFVINLSVDRALSDEEKPLSVPVLGAEYAPNLVRYLESKNLEVTDAPETRDEVLEAVKLGTHDVVVVVAESFGEQFESGIPARIGRSACAPRCTATTRNLRQSGCSRGASVRICCAR